MSSCLVELDRQQKEIAVTKVIANLYFIPRICFEEISNFSLDARWLKPLQKIKEFFPGREVRIENSSLLTGNNIFREYIFL